MYEATSFAVPDRPEILIEDLIKRRQSLLPRAVSAVTTSPGGTLTTSVRPDLDPMQYGTQLEQLRRPGPGIPAAAEQASVLPSSIEAYRKRAADLYKQGSDLYNADVDTSALQAFAKQQGERGNASMLNAMAAQFAGESFQPIQAQYLKRAAAAQEPIKIGGGMLTPDGQFIKDPFAGQEKKAEFLLQQAKAYEQMAATAETAQERAAALAAQNQVQNELRALMVQIAGFNAQTGRINAQTNQTNASGGGSLGVGNAQQIGSGPNQEPIFRQKNGQLFTYNEAAQAVPYTGPVKPKASNAEPTVEENRMAGLFFQADNARRNMEIVMKESPSAAYPTVGERAAGFIPGIGEDVANTMRPETRQRFVQAAGSMAEALLRAATGAGVNESEQKQKIAELVPQLGDKPGNVKQKLESYDAYMKSLRARAGRALPKDGGGGSGKVVDFNSLPGGR